MTSFASVARHSSLCWRVLAALVIRALGDARSRPGASSVSFALVAPHSGLSAVSH